MHVPDNWVIIKINGNDPHYRVLAGWSGGYATGDSWKLNSGVIRIDEVDGRLNFTGASGSVYSCGINSYGLRMNNGYIWDKLKDIHGDLVEMLPEDTDWKSVDWIIN